MQDNDLPSVYYIPENFMGESRFWQGRIRTRYAIDSLILGFFPLGIIGLWLSLSVMKNMDVEPRIMVAILMLAPGFLLGQIGFNGDPISVAFMNILTWLRSRQVRLFNPNMRLLGTDPVKVMLEENAGKDAIVRKFNEMQKARIDKKLNMKMVEGETFEYAYDPGIDDYTDDNGDYTKEPAPGEVDVSIEREFDMEMLSSVYFGGDGYMEPESFKDASEGSEEPQDEF